MIPIKTQKIRKFGGAIIGTLEEDAIGNQLVRNFYGQIIAKYDKKQDVTRDFYGKILTKGNTCVGALYDPQLNKAYKP